MDTANTPEEQPTPESVSVPKPAVDPVPEPSKPKGYNQNDGSFTV